MQYGLNSRDLESTYGVTVLSDSDPFLAFPEAKESLTNDFREENGIYIDLSKRTFKPRSFTLKCSLIANNWNDFFDKYDALFTELSKPGVHDLYVGRYGKIFKLYYMQQNNIAVPGKLANGRVGVTFDLILSETNPRDTISPVYLVDQHDIFIVA